MKTTGRTFSPKSATHATRCGAGLRAPEVCNLTTGDIDSDRMLIHVVQGTSGRLWSLFASFNTLFVDKRFPVISAREFTCKYLFSRPNPECGTRKTAKMARFPC